MSATVQVDGSLDKSRELKDGFGAATRANEVVRPKHPVEQAEQLSFGNSIQQQREAARRVFGEQFVLKLRMEQAIVSASARLPGSGVPSSHVMLECALGVDEELPPVYHGSFPEEHARGIPGDGVTTVHSVHHVPTRSRIV